VEIRDEKSRHQRRERVGLSPVLVLAGRRRFALVAWIGLLALVGCGCSNPSSWGISGTVTGATAVTVNLTGAANASTTTEASGNYSFGSLANGSYTLTPSKADYTFSLASIAVTVNGGNVTGQNFVSAATLTRGDMYVSTKHAFCFLGGRFALQSTRCPGCRLRDWARTRPLSPASLRPVL